MAKLIKSYAYDIKTGVRYYNLAAPYEWWAEKYFPRLALIWGFIRLVFYKEPRK